MTQHAPVLIVLLPLTASLLCMLFSRIKRTLGSWIVMASIVGAFINACIVLHRVISSGGQTWVGGLHQSVSSLLWIR